MTTIPQKNADLILNRIRQAKHSVRSMARLIKKPDGSSVTDAGLAKWIRNQTMPLYAAAQLARYLDLSQEEASELFLNVKSQPVRVDAVAQAANQLVSELMKAVRSAS